MSHCLRLNRSLQRVTCKKVSTRLKLIYTPVWSTLTGWLARSLPDKAGFAPGLGDIQISPGLSLSLSLSLTACKPTTINTFT
jgi:hypothetical protein